MQRSLTKFQRSLFPIFKKTSRFTTWKERDNAMEKDYFNKEDGLLSFFIIIYTITSKKI